MQVRLAAGECGGSYLGTTGGTVIDAVLCPQPSPSTSYTASAAGTTRPPKTGTLTVCAFLDDNEYRQFATDVDTQVRVVPARRHRTHRPPRGPSRRHAPAASLHQLTRSQGRSWSALTRGREPATGLATGPAGPVAGSASAHPLGSGPLVRVPLRTTPAHRR